MREGGMKMIQPKKARKVRFSANLLPETYRLLCEIAEAEGSSRSGVIDKLIAHGAMLADIRKVVREELDKNA